MRLTEISYDSSAPVESYGPGFFRMGGVVHHGAALVSPAGISDWGGYEDTEALIALCAHCDVVLVGTGAEMAHLPADFRAAIEASGLGIEPMATPTACRSYNILLSEGRRIAAALLPV